MRKQQAGGLLPLNKNTLVLVVLGVGGWSKLGGNKLFSWRGFLFALADLAQSRASPFVNAVFVVKVARSCLLVACICLLVR